MKYGSPAEKKKFERNRELRQAAELRRIQRSRQDGKKRCRQGYGLNQRAKKKVKFEERLRKLGLKLHESY